MSSKIRPKKNRNKPGQDRVRVRRTPTDLAFAAGSDHLPRAFDDDVVLVFDNWQDQIPPALAPGTELVDYEIEYEPMLSAEEQRLSLADQERLHQAGTQALAGGSSSALIADLERLIGEFPNIPSLYNHLYTTFRRARRDEDADRILDETRARFPDYLFGMLNMIERSLHEGCPEDVPEILNGHFSLHKLYPGQRRFHVSEYLAFHGTLAWYFHEISEEKLARTYLGIMEETGPDFPITQAIRQIISRPSLQQMMRGMTTLLGLGSQSRRSRALSPRRSAG